MRLRMLLDPNSPIGGGAAAPAGPAPTPSAGGASFSTGTAGDAGGASFSSNPAGEEPVSFEAALREQQTAGGGAGAGNAPAAAVPAGQAPTPAQVASIRDQMRAAGIDPANYADDNAAMQAMIERYQQFDHVLPYANFGYQMQPYAQQFQAWLQQQATAGQQQQAPAPAQQQQQGWDLESHFKKLYEAPPYDPAWERMVRYDAETGTYVGVHPQVPITVVDGVNKYANWYKSTQKDFFNGNPYKKTYDAIEEPILRKVQELVNGMFQQQQQVSFRAQFEQQHAKQLYQTDQNGNMVVDRFSGQPQTTPFGSRFYQHLQGLLSHGMPETEYTYEQAKNLATNDLLLAHFQQQQMQQQAPAQAAVPALPQSGPNMPQVPGMAPPAAAAPNPAQVSQQHQQTFLNNAFQRAGHIPNGGAAASGAPSEPVFSSFGDMEGFFERAARQAGQIR